MSKPNHKSEIFTRTDPATKREKQLSDRQRIAKLLKLNPNRELTAKDINRLLDQYQQRAATGYIS